MTQETSIIVCGLPESGKTTYLAALWQVLLSPEIDTVLKLVSREYDNYAYIQEIHQIWLQGQEQTHTGAMTQMVVGLDLGDESNNKIQLLVPDHSGEIYQALWSERQCSTQIAETLKNRAGIIVFINIDTIEKPRPLIHDIIDAKKISGNGGTTVERTEHDAASAHKAGANKAERSDRTPYERPFDPSETPDQVKLVDILQILQHEAFRSGHRRIAIVLSAWDLYASSGQTPDTVLKRELPLLYDYLETGEHEWEKKVYGVSAQGGEYTDPKKGETISKATRRLLDLQPSERMTIIDNGKESRDLTLPIAWLWK